MRLLFALSLLFYISSALCQKRYDIWFDKPAPNRGADFSIVKSGGKPYDYDWENWSMPIGNGFFGASLFGRTDTERIQLTENTLSNRGIYNIGSLTSFAELFIEFNHTQVSNYRRSLSLNDAIATISYSYANTNYTREYFASYPDKVIVISIKADRPGSVNFKLSPSIPYLRNPDTSKIKDGRTGVVYAEGNEITLKGNMQYYNIDYEGRIKVISYSGKVVASNDSNNANGKIEVIAADSAHLLISLATNYQLRPTIFTENIPEKKLQGFPDPHSKIKDVFDAISKKSYSELLKSHLSDYHLLFSRAQLDLKSLVPKIPTDSLLTNYKNGKCSNYIEELYFQFGRYLLIASSRKGALPANLQGVWSQYDISPWTSGYWHNVNVQMNYWPAFNTNLAELFDSYVDYNQAFRSKASTLADEYIKRVNPAYFDSVSGNNGWSIGTGASPYAILGVGGHSGPGTGGFTTKLFWDQFQFTRNKDILKETDYPAMVSMATFLMKCLKDTLGYYLASPSSSPEQRQKGVYYQSVGCAFDQQMIYECISDVLKASIELNNHNSSLLDFKKILGKLDPVQVGWSGQIKEYREENKYGEIGEYKHRHISQLVGLYPGTVITSKTQAWMDAAKLSLSERGHISTGWAVAHRLNAWARAKEGDSAYHLFQNLLKRNTNPNLWNTHPPYQIDGNFGGTAGVAEMLLQSHEGYIEPLPALPSSWQNGKYTGLVARGNFVISVEWQSGNAIQIDITSRAGENCTLRYPNIHTAILKNQSGVLIKFKKLSNDIILFPTSQGETYTLTNIIKHSKPNPPRNLTINKMNENKISLSWRGDDSIKYYKLYVAIDSSPTYTFIKKVNLKNNTFIFNCSSTDFDRATFKVTGTNKKGIESNGTIAFYFRER
jgi:alpha-L-fucosidase 2